MAVLAVGDPDDASLGYIVWLARNRSIDTIVLAEAELGVHWWVTCPEDPREWALHVGDREVALSEVSGALVRLNPRPATPSQLALSDHEAAFYVVERRSGLLWFLDRAPFVVINRPSRGRSNGCKPVHMAELQTHGLVVPRWCVTNDTPRAHAFVATCGNGAVYKADELARAWFDNGGVAYVIRRPGGTPVAMGLSNKE